MAPVLQMGRIDVSAAVEEEFNDWYNTVYIPGLSDCSGLHQRPALRRHRGPTKISDPYEFEHAQVPESEAWNRTRDSNPWTRRVRPNLLHDEGSPGVYRRISPK